MHMKTNEANTPQPLDAEALSALIDGALQDPLAEQALDRALGDAQAFEQWCLFHAVGDAMRSAGHHPGRMASSVFVERVMQRVAQEPRPASAPAVALAEHSSAGARPAADAGASLAVLGAAGQGRANAANAPRWRLVAGFASVAAVAATAWAVIASGWLSGDGGGAGLARAPGPAPTELASAGDAGVMIRDARLDELMAAHRQFGGTSALQMPSGFLRNATFDASR